MRPPADGHAVAGNEDPSWGGVPIGFSRIQGAVAVGTVVAAGAHADADLIGKRLMVDCWLRDWDDPVNRDKTGYFKTGYFGSERDDGFAQ
ncbi:MDR/zinc-dependent alcohol dehydrogenase-like family protein [Tateyamaria pelophila]|uniref:hypothetical protein n=1 Tax=Tateyamaria pelophila TaxID=328415 RepID=UPI001CBB1100|nr:hypothetical protein [Tateyamaria pelophila]